MLKISIPQSIANKIKRVTTERNISEIRYKKELCDENCKLILYSIAIENIYTWNKLKDTLLHACGVV